MKKTFLVFLVLLTVLCFAAGCGQKTPSDESGAVSTGPYQFRSDELANYVIVYSDENPDYFDLAYRLNEQIYTKYGKILNVIRSSNATPSPYEILLGDTGRVMEYSVTVQDGKFRIHVGGSFSAEKAIDFLCQQVFNGQEFALDSGEYYQTSFLTASQEMTEDATARIMSANILADAFADSSYKEAHYRAEIFAGMLVSYTPDILGIQEADENWNDVLDMYLEKIQKSHGITYERLLASYENKVNYSSLLYRSDKFKAETSDLSVFSWWTNKAFNHNYHMRNVSWARFSALDAPEKTFLVANTHWSYRTEHANGQTYLFGSNTPIAVNELRTQCKDETNRILSTLRQENPGVPIFLTGDFNTSLPFFTDSGWTPAAFRLISEEALNSGTSISLVPSSGHFDHLFGTGNYTIKHFAFFNNTNQHSLLTDHPFVYADLAF